jgi:hypothetical protein
MNPIVLILCIIIGSLVISVITKLWQVFVGLVLIGLLIIAACWVAENVDCTVNLSDVFAQEVQQPAPTETAQPTFPIGEVVMANDPLRIRKGPGTQYAQIGSAQKGERLLIIGEAQDWYQILTQKGTKGYATRQFIRLLRLNTTMSSFVSALPIPYVDEGACPGEGCTYKMWTLTADTIIRQARDQQSPAAFTVRKGQRVQAETVVVITTKPGRARVSKTTDLGGKIFKPGDIVYIYTYLGEGWAKLWFQGTMFAEVQEAAYASECFEVIEKSEAV